MCDCGHVNIDFSFFMGSKCLIGVCVCVFFFFLEENVLLDLVIRS